METYYAATDCDFPVDELSELQLGAADRIIPDKLNRKNFEGYTDPGSVAEFVEFPGRGHFICCQPGWEEVAQYAVDWLDGLQLDVGARRISDEVFH